MKKFATTHPRRRIATLCIALVAAALAIPSVSTGQVTITTFDHNQDGIGGDNTGGDTYINENDPNDNYGSSNVLFVRNPPSSNSTPNHRTPYAKFDLSAIQDTSTASDARVQIYNLGFTGLNNSGTSPLNSLQGLTIDVYGLVDESQDVWSESDVSWNGTGSFVPAPGHQNDGSVNNGLDFVSGEVMYLGSFDFDNSGDPSTGWSQEVSLPDLLSLVQADTNGSLTLMFSLDESGLVNTNYFMASKESELTFLTGTPGQDDVPLGSLAPRLILDGVELSVAAVPEPGTVAIWTFLGFGAVLFIAARNRMRKHSG